jgi:transposase-like protein
MGRKPAYSREQAAEAVAQSRTYSETLRRLGLRAAGGNHRTLRRHLERWGISTTHFDPNAGRARGGKRRAKPLDEILVEHSTFSRGHLKERLYAAGLKTPSCELCGQGPVWAGKEMALVLDHINGVADDNRLENLRIVCPNCAATLETHCGKNLGLRTSRPCGACGGDFLPRRAVQRYCSVQCARRAAVGIERPSTRKVGRPPRQRLVNEVAADGFCATARRYGVSDNAVRKWLRMHERDRPPPPAKD